MDPRNTIQPSGQPPQNPEAPPTMPPKAPDEKPDKKSVVRTLALFLVLFAIAMAAGLYFGGRQKNNNQSTPPQTQNTAATKTSTVKLPGLQLDPKKNYGNKYASGLLPVGDSHYVTAAAKTGYIYACGTYAQSLSPNNGGAGTRGPWFVNNNAQYDLAKKLHVKGSVMWQGSFSNKISGATRTIATNDLPGHPTGTFPIASTDPAYTYDRNPNSIKGQTLTYSLSAAPAYGDPHCMGGEAGIMLSGIALFNGFDAGGRDAGAWEIQDNCDGHPQKSGEYHYHSLSSCIKTVGVSTVIGFALDGFPVTGPVVSSGNILTTSDLDECHGLTSQIALDGKAVTMYHYVMTQDFPYSVSCFRGTAIQPPGQAAATPHP